jgi:hypothetical protein
MVKSDGNRSLEVRRRYFEIVKQNWSTNLGSVSIRYNNILELLGFRNFSWHNESYTYFWGTKYTNFCNFLVQDQVDACNLDYIIEVIIYLITVTTVAIVKC